MISEIMEYKDFIAIILSFLALIISALSLIYSKKQAKNQNKSQEKSNDLSALNIVTQLQIEISRKQISLINQKIKTDEDILEFNAKTEDFLNLLELLSIYILSSNLDEELMRTIYKTMIIQTIKNHEEKFGTATSYKNIKKLYERWTSDEIAISK